MIELDANIARYYFEAAQLPPDTFAVVRFSGVEEISQLFRFELELVSEEPDLAFSDLIGQPATFTRMGGDDEAVPTSGIVTHFEQAGRTADRVAYRAVLAPRLWRLSLSFQSRIFQQQTVEDIVRQVLEEAGFTSEDFRFELRASYATRAYCVQYQETDLSFVSRLLEHEGICYFFEHTGADGEVLVMTDDRGSHPPLRGAAPELRYQEDAGMVGRQPETAWAFTCREQIVTGKVMMKDHNYRTPETKLQVESQINGEMPGTRYEYGGHFEDAGQGRRLARVRNEEIECRRRVMQGESDGAGLRSGHRFTLAHHYRGDLDGDYLLTRVAHEGSQAGALNVGIEEDGQPEASYRNRFTCIPAGVQYRPERRTPKPQVPGVMTARIESAGGDYAYIDEEGAYRAKLHFDRSDRSDGTATKPIRMKQAYSGPDYGMHFPNHANTEMIVACVNGDIDRPLALGTAPNPSQASPAVAGNKTQNVLRTFAGNELVMDDAKGEAQVRLGTPDANELLLDDKEDRLRLATTGKHTATLDDKNENIKVQTKAGHVLLLDDKNKKIILQSKKGHLLSIDDEEETMTLADESGDNTFTIDIGAEKLVIKTASGDIDLHAPHGTIDIQATELNCETSGDTTFKAANISSEAQSDHAVKATNINEEAAMDLTQKGTNISSEAQMEHKTTGTNVAAEAQMKHDVKGAMLNVQASGVHTIKGSLVKIN